jgi:hypothetical protein
VGIRSQEKRDGKEAKQGTQESPRPSGEDTRGRQDEEDQRRHASGTAKPDEHPSWSSDLAVAPRENESNQEMTTKKGATRDSRVKNLPTRSLTGRQAKRVKGGAITIKQKLGMSEKAGPG